MSSKYQKLISLTKHIKKTHKTEKPKPQKKKKVPQTLEEESVHSEESPQIVDEEETKIETIVQDNSDRIFYVNNSTLLIRLELHEHMMLSATFTMRVLTGRALAFGYTFEIGSKLAEIHSQGKMAIPIQAHETGLITEESLPTILKNLKEMVLIENGIQDSVKEWMKREKNAMILIIESSHPINSNDIKIFGEIEDYEELNPLPITYPKTIDQEYSKFIIQALSASSRRRKILIAGDKNTGKSLLSLYVMNKTLSYLNKKVDHNDVFYLETDLGQNSFFFPGTIGMFNFKEPVIHNLHTPCIQKPLFFEFIGEFSPVQHTAAYLKAVQNAINFYNYSSRNSSLIINTHGYISNIGENILYDMIRIVEPDVIIILDKGNNNKETSEDHGYLQINQASIIEAEIRKRTFHNRASIYHVPRSEYKGPAIWQVHVPNLADVISHKKDKKDAMMLTYLLNGKFYHNNMLAPITRISQLSIAKPVEVPFDQFLNVVLAGSQTRFFYRADFMKWSLIFLASVVSLHFSPLLNTRDSRELQRFECEEIYAKSSSKGFGFIRDIDPDKKTILMVTPLSQLELSTINMLVRSNNVQFSKDLYKDDSLLNVENWIIPTQYDEKDNPIKTTKPFLNDCVYGVGSESYRNIHSLRKIQ